LNLKTHGSDSLEVRKPWVVEGDIKGCFDNISHDYLMEKVGDFPLSRLLLRWLKVGYVDSDGFHDIDLGTPQGSIISPLLSNIALDGLEAELGVTYKKRKSSKAPFFRLILDDYKMRSCRRAFIRYADDFVVLCETREDAE
jgi:RNA-directed DNA polymerase